MMFVFSSEHRLRRGAFRDLRRPQHGGGDPLLLAAPPHGPEGHLQVDPRDL